jgi:hypothetical protein
MKRLPLEVKQALDVLLTEQERCFHFWVDRCDITGSREKYFEAKSAVQEFKKQYRQKGYAI